MECKTFQSFPQHHVSPRSLQEPPNWSLWLHFYPLQIIPSLHPVFTNVTSLAAKNPLTLFSTTFPFIISYLHRPPISSHRNLHTWTFIIFIITYLRAKFPIWLWAWWEYKPFGTFQGIFRTWEYRHSIFHERLTLATI